MATWNITVNAGSGVGSGGSGSNAITPPGDFDGATITDVSVSGSPTITTDGATNDTLGIRWRIQTSTGTAIWGDYGSDAASACSASLGDSATSSTITDGSSPSPAPSTAVAADWDQVAYSANYTNNGMPDGETCSWSSFTIVVTYTAGPPQPGSDPLQFGSDAPTVSIQEIASPPADSLAFTGNVPDLVSPLTASPSYYAMRAWSQTGLQFRGVTPTISVSSGGNNTEEPGSDSLVLTGSAPGLSWSVAAGNADSLVLTGNQPVRLVDHIVAPGSDSLVITETTASLDTGVAVPADGLSLSSSAAGLSWSISVPADSLAFTGYQPDRIVSSTVSPGAGGLVISESSPLPSKLITAGAADSLAFTGYAPDLPVTLLPDSGSLIVGSSAPGLSWSVSVPADGLDLAGATPVRIVDSHVLPGVGSLQTGSAAPEVSRLVNPTSDGLVLTGHQPTVDEAAPGAIVREPGAGSLIFGSSAPTVGEDRHVYPSAGSLVLGSSAPTAGGDKNSNPSAGSLQLGAVAPTLLLDVVAQPGSDSLAVSSQASSIGSSASPSAGSLSLTGAAPTAGDQAALPSADSLALTGGAVVITGGHEGTPIVNDNATTSVPTNVEQCDLSGFRQLPGSLKFTWKGYGVRRKSYDERHPQESVRSFHQKQKGPRRPEQDDRFIENLYPSGVDPDADL